MPGIKVFDERLLAGIPAGTTWVAISADQKRVVGKGQTIDQALKRAQKTQRKGEPQYSSSYHPRAAEKPRADRLITTKDR